uniref:C2H2-type domain-containing protein n=1 Tax=Periophthalmus magnuspinnatus TaxID=409849 RepID=A0A3B3Z7L0_9GOBI
SSQCDGQGSNEDPMKDTGDGNIPALYKSLFFPEMGGKKAKRSDSDARKPFSCPVCTKAFESEELLDKHVVIHNNQSPIRCPICNKPCRNNSSFKKHLNIHTEERPFRCSVCMKGFNQKCNLKRHMQTHTEEKSFSCPEFCDKAFAQKTVFIIHMRTHTGEKPFSCAVCKKRFRDKCHLKRHIKTHGDQAGAQDELHDSI